jgi:hypothetical protein
MFFRSLFTLFLLSSSFVAFSQKATLKGYVRDQAGKSVPSVLVWEKENKANGTVSNDDGFFQLSIPGDAAVTIVFKAVGSDPSEKVVMLKSGEVNEVNIVYDAGVTLDTFTIYDKRDREDGIQPIDTRLSGQLPTINAGIEKFLIQAPVNFSSELSSSYSVRGGSFDENLIYVNDIQVYRPFLVRAGEQEGLSFPNPDMVSAIDFSAGGFQAKFGDKMSSVLDIQYARPDSFYGNFTIGLLGGQLQFADISKNRKWTTNNGVRYRDYSYILNTLDVQADYRPRFTDVQSYTTFRPAGEHGPWEVSFLGNISANRYNFVPQTRETDVGTINEALRLTVFYQGQEETSFDTYFGAVSTRYNPSENSQLKFIASAFRTNEQERFDVLGAYRLDELERDLGSNEFGEILRSRGVGGFLQHARNELNATVYTFTHRGFREFDRSGQLLQWGADFVIESINDRLKEWELLDSAGYASPRPQDNIGNGDPDYQRPDVISMRNQVRAVNEVASQRVNGWVQNRWKREWGDGDSFTITAGIRGNHWSFNGQTVISPRANLAYVPRWKTARKNKETGATDTLYKDLVITAAFGYYYQPPFYREMRDFQGRVNPDIRAQESIHYILGLNYVFHAWSRPFKLKTEAYYKSMRSLIPYEVENVRQRYYATNNSNGYATGLDVMLNGEFIRGVQSWLRASLLLTQEDLTNDFFYIRRNASGDTIQPGFTLDNVAVDSILVTPGFIPRPTDQRFSFSMLFQDEMPRAPQYKVLLNMFFATGLPYGRPDQRRYDDVFRTRSYIRADIGLSRDLFYKKKKNNFINRNVRSGSIALEVFNLLGVNNIINHQWIEDINGRQYGIPTYLTGRRLNLRFSIQF